MTYPKIKLKKNHDQRARTGHPWIYANELDLKGDEATLPSGSLVTLHDSYNKVIGIGYFNPHSLIAIRLLTSQSSASIDQDFFTKRIRRALALRSRLGLDPYCRLVHAEADGLAGLIIDRYDGVLCLQVNTAGIELLTPLIINSLNEVLQPETIILKNESHSRTFEGLAREQKLVQGSWDKPIELVENGIKYYADLQQGQKTGWFYDQRSNRVFMADLAKGKTILDLYSYSGGFGLAAACRGAASVTAVDSSGSALALYRQAALVNDVSITLIEGDVGEQTALFIKDKQWFDIVMADPPALVKSKKDRAKGAKLYRKIARDSSILVAPGGLLCISSCSHHMKLDEFRLEVASGCRAAGRTGRIIFNGGAGADHPVHPFLPENDYLKCLVLQLD